MAAPGGGAGFWAGGKVPFRVWLEKVACDQFLRLSPDIRDCLRRQVALAHRFRDHAMLAPRPIRLFAEPFRDFAPIGAELAALPGFVDGAMAPVALEAAADASANGVGGQGDRALAADVARQSLGVTGAGVRVGILSDSFDLAGGYAADVAAGRLPAGVAVLQDGPSGGADEGRAMAQLVHKVAPGAEISFYTAFRGMADFATGIRALAANGADVIVDDVTYLAEPFFQQGGAIQTAVSAVMAQGVSYFTSASNQGGNFYQHGFDGVQTKLPGLAGTYKAQNFGTAAAPNFMQGLTIRPGSTVTLDLQWDQPFASIGGTGAAGSIGLVLYNAAGRIVATALANRTGGDPVQTLRFTNTTASDAFRLAIVTNGGTVAPNLFKYIVYGQGTTIEDANAGQGSGTVIGHEMQAGVNSVGAIAAASTPLLGGDGRIEAFSSVGPGMVLFDARGNRLTDRVSGHKVDFVAPDGIQTSVFSTFYGTSAAAPNAAGVAALMREANPALRPAQVSTMLARSGVPVVGPANGVGAGLIQADGAVRLALDARPAGDVVPQAAPYAGPQTTAWTTAPLVTPVQRAVAAVAADPTAQGDFLAQVEAGGLDAFYQPEVKGVFALVQNAQSDVVLIDPGWAPHG